ncbi:MAG: DUF1294 domain-containing protein [Candidatus Phytoplasma sp.]|mgnify:FL=1|nr:DUF1294 domain-containing protein [Phytoplasma sp.]
MSKEQIILIYLVVYAVMSLITFLLYFSDKRKAIKNKWRIPESTLLLSSFLLGSLGGLMGLYQLRHKTKHWYFVWVNWLSLMLHIGIFVAIYIWV